MLLQLIIPILKDLTLTHLEPLNYSVQTMLQEPCRDALIGNVNQAQTTLSSFKCRDIYNLLHVNSCMYVLLLYIVFSKIFIQEWWYFWW